MRIKDDEEYARKLQQEAEDEELARKLAAEWNVNPSRVEPSEKIDVPRSIDEIARRVIKLTTDSRAKNLAGRYGLEITNVSWEDPGRARHSKFGPCCSDMTLQVGKFSMPIIRTPNYEDLTWDVPVEKLPVIVGNEIGSVKYQVGLKEYLKDLPSYLHNPKEWKGSPSLISDKDTHVLMSAQACVLPIPRGAETVFNIALKNYQSHRSSPAVLSIIVTENGTSAAIINNSDRWGGQNLFFNDNGKKCSFVAQRVGDKRQLEGNVSTGPLTREEEQSNLILVLQIPLKQHLVDLPLQKKCGVPPPPAYCVNDDMCYLEVEESFPSQRRERMEEAIVSVGDSEGTFIEIGGMKVERDFDYPIRGTMQFYFASSDGEITEEIFKNISDKFKAARDKGTSMGSLVIGANTSRPTQMKSQDSQDLPPWWDIWWATNGDGFSQYSQKKKRDD